MIHKKSEWMRVTKQNPCKICSKIDWCTYTENIICCMRVKSDKYSRNGGYIHRLDETAKVYIPIPKKIEQIIEIDADAMFYKWMEKTTPERLIKFSENIGVEAMALYMIGCAWAMEHGAWAFPMRNAHGKIIGIRLRNESGEKWAVKGSKAGLFFAPNRQNDKTLFVMEGPTDLAAGLTLGYSCVGRPSCMGCEGMINEFIDINKVRDVVIVSDNDDAGIKGAERLQTTLCVPSAIMIPPAKDIRQFLNFGGNMQVINSIIKNLIWKNK